MILFKVELLNSDTIAEG